MAVKLEQACAGQKEKKKNGLILLHIFLVSKWLHSERFLPQNSVLLFSFWGHRMYTSTDTYPGFEFVGGD
jgi:hypothetical protein